MRNKIDRRESPAPVGVVGVGLMGSSIAACLLAAGHAVAGIEKSAGRRKSVKRHILALLREMRKEKLLKRDPASLVRNLTVSEDYGALVNCALVVEAIYEDLDTKRAVLRKIEEYVRPETLIGSNTSALPVTELQKGAGRPQRILGIHWAEPAHITRFMEIVCGRRTNAKFAEQVKALAEQWGKEPSILRRDIRGFITNRCFYALLREAFHLVESGYASVEDVD